MHPIKSLLRFIGLGFFTSKTSIAQITAPMASILKELDAYASGKITEADDREMEAARLAHECECAREEARLALNLVGNYQSLVSPAKTAIAAE